MRQAVNYGSRQRIIWFDLLFLMRLGMNLLAPASASSIQDLSSRCAQAENYGSRQRIN
jgi:hypothetical protein